eukprot:gnl/TRDRNA2_/TRDRNA2_190477_c0_seq1.p1 gnl/TRDRNA2_/TRDRNA2_190477_c0~~gnl/TRDRNA2_/TRDRNA2_190477_c0_seq1.p1  ORF type:complete len:322 (+),score=52.23 gnl/TRDRNA2_/TRDRNA2_190477_c0_seq1:53-967(+)
MVAEASSRRGVAVHRSRATIPVSSDEDEAAGGSSGSHSPRVQDTPTRFRRRFGGLIQRAGLDLRMDVVSSATAALYFQRFFLVEKQEDFDPSRIAAACVWLASKVREDSRRLRDIINSFAALEGRSDVQQALEMEAYWAIRDDLVLHEQALLRALSFDVEPTPAYSFLLELAWLLNCGPATQGVVALAWTLLNDAFCSDICAVSPPERVALACLLLAVELGRRVPHLQPEAEKVALSVDNLCREPFLEDFLGLGPDSGGDELDAICRDLLAIYEAEGGWSARLEAQQRTDMSRREGGRGTAVLA